MATWDIVFPAGSARTGTTITNTAVSPTVPGDFDGSTIDSIAVLSAPTLDTNSGPTNDTVGIRWVIQTDADVDVYGGSGSDAVSLCSAVLGDGVSSDTIAVGSGPSPAPTIAVAADWDEVSSRGNYTAQAMPDGETVDWSAFTVRVTYTPAPLVASGTPSIETLVANGVVSQTYKPSGTPSIDALTASGIASLLGFVSGAGTPSIEALTASGLVTRVLTASGTPTLTALTASGVAKVPFFFEGTIEITCATYTIEIGATAYTIDITLTNVGKYNIDVDAPLHL